MATLLVVIGVIGWYDRGEAASAGRAAAALRQTRSEVSRTVSAGAASSARLARISAEGTARARAGTADVATLGEVDQSLGSAAATTQAQSLDIQTLRQCLTGVSTAVVAVAASDLPRAVQSITAASPSCLTLDGSSGGLSYPFDFPDPFILPVGSKYYGFATNSAAGNIQIIESTDLLHWTTVGDALPEEPAWATPRATWAPAVLRRGTTYVLYYSAVYSATGEQCISDAVASQPQGPYVDDSPDPLECQVNLGGSMDPSPFVDSDGKPYLLWKSQGMNGQPPTLWSQRLTAAGTAFVPGMPTALLAPGEPWQAGIVEGPAMTLVGGHHLLFYSGNDWGTADYGIGVADCTTPLGPCSEETTHPLLASQPAFSGPGGPSLFTDPGGTLWLGFAAWLPGKVGFPNSRVLFLRPVTVDAGVPTIGP